MDENTVLTTHDLNSQKSVEGLHGQLETFLQNLKLLLKVFGGLSHYEAVIHVHCDEGRTTLIILLVDTRVTFKRNKTHCLEFLPHCVMPGPRSLLQPVEPFVQ